MEITPSWYLVTTNDEAIPPEAERMFAKRMGAHTAEVPSSHLAMVSHSAKVVELIEAAAEVVLSSSGESAAVAQQTENRSELGSAPVITTLIGVPGPYIRGSSVLEPEKSTQR